MIGGLNPYPSMKDSGVPWLEKLPAHWEVRRLKYLLKERDTPYFSKLQGRARALACLTNEAALSGGCFGALKDGGG